MISLGIYTSGIGIDLETIITARDHILDSEVVLCTRTVRWIAQRDEPDVFGDYFSLLYRGRDIQFSIPKLVRLFQTKSLGSLRANLWSNRNELFEDVYGRYPDDGLNRILEDLCNIYSLKDHPFYKNWREILYNEEPSISDDEFWSCI